MAQLLLAANATVTIAHSRTADLPAVARTADVLVAAVGRDRMVKGDWIKPGATVIDVGINRSDDGLHGDVDFAEAVEVAGAITPVPGGVGPMTIAMLLRNTLTAAELSRARGRRHEPLAHGGVGRGARRGGPVRRRSSSNWFSVDGQAGRRGGVRAGAGRRAPQRLGQPRLVHGPAALRRDLRRR